ncbi:MAG: hypothetical protein OXF41_14315, partial [bacterium]|nr:hypothetical protein [bacterium]
MTIARACRPPAQAFCRRLAVRWWIAQHPPSVLYREFAGDSLLRLARTGSGGAETAKTVEAVSSGGPSPNRHLLGVERVPPYPPRGA